MRRDGSSNGLMFVEVWTDNANVFDRCGVLHHGGLPTSCNGSDRMLMWQAHHPRRCSGDGIVLGGFVRLLSLQQHD